MTSLSDRPTMSVEEYLQLDRTNPDTRYEYIVVELASVDVRFPVALSHFT